MDPVIQNAIRRRSELRNELRDIDRFLELYKEFKDGSEPRQMTMNVREPSLDSEEQNTVKEGNSSPISSTGDAGRSPGLTREELRPHIRAVIVEAGRPLTRGQILQRLDAREIRVGGRYDRSKNMGTILWRLRDEFRNVPPRGYWPKDVPLPGDDDDD